MKKNLIVLLIALSGIFIFMPEVKALPHFHLFFNDGTADKYDIFEDEEGDCYTFDKATSTLTLNNCTNIKQIWGVKNRDYPEEPNVLNIVVNGTNNLETVLGSYSNSQPGDIKIIISSETHGVLNANRILMQGPGELEITGSIIVNVNTTSQGGIHVRGHNLKITNAAKVTVNSTADRMIWMQGSIIDGETIAPGNLVINNASLKCVYNGTLPSSFASTIKAVVFDHYDTSKLVLVDIDNEDGKTIGLTEPTVDLTGGEFGFGNAKYYARTEVTEETRTRFQVLAKEYNVIVNVPALSGGAISAQSTATAGEIVKVVATPADGKQIKPGSIVVKKIADETSIAIDADGCFIMPAEDVVIADAVFESANDINVNGTITNGEIITKVTAAPSEVVTINIKPNRGYVLVPNSLIVTDTLDNEITVENNTFTMPNGDVYITASFTKEHNFKLAIGVSATNVEIPSKILIGVPTKIYLTPPANYEYSRFYLYIDPDSAYVNEEHYTMTKDGNVLTLTLNEDIDVRLDVKFAPIKYDLIFDESVNGTFYSSYSSYAVGDDVKVWAYSNGGYRLVKGTISVRDSEGYDVETIETDSGVSFTMPDSDVTITAEFEEAYEIDISTLWNYAYVEMSPDNSYYLPDEVITFTIDAYPGWRIKPGTLKVMQGLNEIIVENNTFTMPDSDVTITAEFEEVELPAPVITIRSNNYNKNEIEWEPVEGGAFGYEVSYATSKTGKYTVIARVDSDENSYTHTGLIAGKTYYYRVRTVALASYGYHDEIYYRYSVYSNIASVKAVPSIPTANVTSYGYNSVKLSWTKVDGVSGYVIYRATSLNGKYSLIKTITSGNTLSYTNGSLSLGKTYYYKVRAYKTVNRVRIYGGSSIAISQKIMPSAVNFKVDIDTSTSLKLTWSKVSGATYYQIYTCTSDDLSTCTNYKTTKNTSYVVSGLTLASKYFYNVQACRTYYGKTTCGSLNNVESQYVTPARPIYKVTNTSYTSLGLTWNAVTGADYYYCDHKLASESNYQNEVIESSEPTCSFTGLTTGETYDVYVVSVYEKGDKVYDTKAMETRIKVVPKTPIITVGGSATANEITWDEIEGATSYEVYRSYYSNKSFVKVATVTEESYSNTGLTYGKTYYYKVRAINTNGDVNTYSAYSNVASRYVRPNATVTNVASYGYNSVKLSWTKVDGVSGYVIYRATSLNGKYSLIKTITSGNTLSYTNGSLSLGKTYYYKVRSYKTVGRSKIYSYYSNTVNEKVRPATPNLDVLKDTNTTLKSSWNKISGATYYQIDKCTSLDPTTCTKIGTSKSTSYIDKNLTLTNEYNYKVKACRTYYRNTTCGDYSEVMSQIVVPAKPTITIVPKTATSLLISWPAIAGANKYSVAYRIANALSGEYDETTETSFEIEGLETGTAYEVIIQSLYDDGENLYDSIQTKQIIRMIPPAPKVSAVVAAYNKTRLTWPSVSYANSYEVYRSSYSTKGFTKIATVTDNEYISSALTYGNTYYYKVIAIVQTEDYGAVKSGYSNIVKGKVSLATPTVVVTPESYSSIKISYQEIPYATGYQIYRATSKSGYYSKIATITDDEYVNSKLSFNKNYYYKVRAYVKVGTKIYYGSFSSVQYAKTALSAPVLTGYEFLAGILMEFTRVSGATKYEIYRSSDSVTFTRIATTTDLSLMEQDIEYGTYHYKVRAIRVVSGKNYYSPYSNVLTESYSDHSNGN